MGVECLFCCFKGMSDNVAGAIGLVASILSFGFMMWGVIDIYFDLRGIKALYLITFILLCLCLISFIVLLILLCMKRKGAINKVGRIVCIVVIVFSIAALILEIIVWIFLIHDYVNTEKDGGSGQQIPSHDWAAIFVPTIISLIALVVIALVANYLHKVFTDRLNADSYPISVAQTSVGVISNPEQPVIFPNNNVPVSPLENNVAYPVPIQKNEMNN